MQAARIGIKRRQRAHNLQDKCQLVSFDDHDYGLRESKNK